MLKPIPLHNFVIIKNITYFDIFNTLKLEFEHNLN